ncbi:DUF6193 family natural product biosynthesis protein [Streptacidiphilus sp. ASG 303]|uniref:DUF6193 family natural product biosynthesis protein n=1 Tax=Streptacidiphilus sp. ASG 303 TaxID=2896847 RepID=UPI001E4B0BD2|nr:DUF6193 family natural product biosynthesis protein [Streptacidiphilus sp. ASG 303]MCD0485340.1 DUF6193 family natural product biosynthesis protein [Streptacidiphilus sp. ASG 303]
MRIVGGIQLEDSSTVTTHDADSLDVIEEEWQRLLSSDRVDRELVQAAYAQPRLRQLFPWVGMWELHFSRCTEHPATWDVPYIAPMKGGGFLVAGPSRSEVVGPANTAEAAVAIVVEHLPPGCGRAFLGNRHQLAEKEQTEQR